MPLFEVAIIQTQTKKEADDGVGGEKLLFGPKFVVAKDDASAALSCMMGDDAPKNIDLNRAQAAPPPCIAANFTRRGARLTAAAAFGGAVVVVVIMCACCCSLN